MAFDRNNILYPLKKLRKLFATKAELFQHAAKTIFSPEGVHGLRYYNGKLQGFDGDEWVDIATSTLVPPVFNGAYAFDGSINFNN